MKVKIWTAICNNGDGSSSVYIFPSREKLRGDLCLNDDDFRPHDDVPVEIDCEFLDTNDYEVVS